MNWKRLIIAGVIVLFTGTTYAQATGSIVSWGGDWFGQVSNTPTGNDFVQVAGGSVHSLALKSDGSIISWGPEYAYSVMDTPTDTGFVQVAAGSYYSLALKTDGSIVSWGSEFSGSVTDTPTDTGFVQVAGGFQYHSLALKADGSIVSWGWDNRGQVTDTPTDTGFVQVAAGSYHSVALKTDGSIVSWGGDWIGQVTDTPTDTGFVQVAAGYNHSLALKTDGSIVSWGSDEDGQITDTPTETGFVQVAGGKHHSLALKANGSIVSWGRDDYGQVTNTPTESGFVQVAGGGWHSVGLLLHQSNETPLGEGVVVRPSPVDEFGDPVEGAPAISLTFDSVSVSGETSVIITENGPPPPAGLRLLGIDGGTTYIDINTTATFVGDVEICINYSGFTPAVDPDELSLAHIVDGEWINISLSKDLFNSVLCGPTTSFSYFAIVQVADPLLLLSELFTAVNDLDATEEVRLSLTSKLEKVERLVEGGDTADAAGDLVKKFISKVQKYRDKHISILEADELIRRATELKNVLLF